MSFASCPPCFHSCKGNVSIIAVIKATYLPTHSIFSKVDLAKSYLQDRDDYIDTYIDKLYQEMESL